MTEPTHVFALIPLDLDRVQRYVREQGYSNVKFLFPEQEATLQPAKEHEVHFVVSTTSMLASSLQGLMFQLFELNPTSSFSVLRLDDCAIPTGFRRLRSLPEIRYAPTQP